MSESNTNHYKIPLILAIILHVVILLALIIKFTHHTNYTLDNDVTIIKAVVVSPTKAQPIAKPIPPPPKPQPVATPTPPPKPIIPKEQIKPKEAPVVPLKSKQVIVTKPVPPKPIPKPKVDLQKQLDQELTKELDNKKHEATQQSIDQQLAAEQKELSQQAAAAKNNGEIDKYKALLLQAISQNWVVPQNVTADISCQLMVHVAPGGEVLEVNLISSSGNDVLDRSAKTAVLKSSPLPVPKDPALFDDFRYIKLTARPAGVSAN